MDTLIITTRVIGIAVILISGIWLVLADEKHKDGASNSTWVDAWLFLGFFTFLSSFVKGAVSVIEDRNRAVFLLFVVVLTGIGFVCWPLFI